MSSRAAGGAGTIRQIGDLTLDGTAARIEWRGRRVSLTLSEFRVVQLLVDRAGQDASYRDIYDTVKGVGFIAGTGTDGYRANVRATDNIANMGDRFLSAEFTLVTKQTTSTLYSPGGVVSSASEIRSGPAVVNFGFDGWPSAATVSLLLFHSHHPVRRCLPLKLNRFMNDPIPLWLAIGNRLGKQHFAMDSFSVSDQYVPT